MKLGCSTLLFGGFDLDTALSGIQQAGYEAVELCSIPGLGEHFRAGQDRAVYEAIRGQLDAVGLLLESVGCSGSLRTDRFEPLMEAAAVMGAPVMTLGSGGVADDDASWAEVIAAVRRALPVCERTGVKLALKPHVRSAVHGVATAARFVAEIASEWVGLNLDNTHLQRDGDDPAQAVRELKDHVLTARVRDYRSDDLSIGELEHQIPGKGTADVAGYLRALAEVPGLAVVTVEMAGTHDLLQTEVQRVVGETCIALASMLS